MPFCFIIMPISTPKDYHAVYNNEADHFKHVLNCLIVPAVEKAELTPIKPVSEGSEVIHGEIIKNLEEADLVLCDMSILNPNVFFELGIRTALNKPVAMIKDNNTNKIPFDNLMINCHTYKRELKHWEMNTEIDLLTQHLKVCQEKNTGENALWKYFGMKSIAESTEVSGDVKDYLQILEKKIDKLNQKPGYASYGGQVSLGLDGFVYNEKAVISEIFNEAYKFGLEYIKEVEIEDGCIILTIDIRQYEKELGRNPSIITMFNRKITSLYNLPIAYREV